MIFRRAMVALAVSLAWFSFCSQQSWADIVLAFENHADGTPVTSLDLSVGDTAEIDVYALFNPQVATGLASFNVKASLDSNIVRFDPFSFQPGADFPSATASVDSSGVLYASGSKTVPATGDKILLGTVRVNAFAAGQSMLAFQDPNPTQGSDGDFSGAGLTQYDAIIFGTDFSGSYGVSVAAVPEPGSMSLVALAGGGLYLANRRRRRSAK